MNMAMTSHVYLAQKIRESWSIVILYPCAMLIAWVPGTISGLYLIYLQGTETRRNLPNHVFVINDYLTAINALYGPLLTLIFYTKTLEARQAWIRNFRRLYHFITNSNADMDEDKSEERCGSIISVDDIEITTTTTSTTSINPISKDVARIDEL